MGEVQTEITLVNIGDQNGADRGYMPQNRVRRLTVNAVVHTDAWTLVINEETRQKLGLLVKRTDGSTFAGGGKVPCQVTEPAAVHWKDRETPAKQWYSPAKRKFCWVCCPLRVWI